MSSRLSLCHTAPWSRSLHRPHANHRLCRAVLETLEPLSGDRKCFRMINGVLAERTVKDVVPALKTNLEGLEKVLTELTEQYNTKTTEMEKWKVSLGLAYFFSLRGSVSDPNCRRRTMSKWCSRIQWTNTARRTPRPEHDAAADFLGLQKHGSFGAGCISVCSRSETMS